MHLEARWSSTARSKSTVRAQRRASLRERNELWGYRDTADVAAEAAKHGLELAERKDMPANNFLLRFSKAEAA